MSIKPFLLSSFCLVALSGLPEAVALPAGEKVSRGSASFERKGDQLTIRQKSDKLAVNWRSFSIESGKTARFVQPKETSTALNRVVGGSRSLIDGSLEANGKVILINPAGVTVGPNGIVDVRAFTASTQNLTDDEFIGGGELLFEGNSDASIENLGIIRASGGDAILIARNIENAGQIAATGLVGLAAGSEVRIKPVGEERIFIQTDTRKTAKVNLKPSGAIAAAAAEIKAAGNPYATAINLDGLMVVNPGEKKLIVKAEPGQSKVTTGQNLAVRTFTSESGGADGWVGSGAVIKAASGTLNLGGSNSGSGATLVLGGTITTGTTTTGSIALDGRTDYTFVIGGVTYSLDALLGINPLLFSGLQIVGF